METFALYITWSGYKGQNPGLSLSQYWKHMDTLFNKRRLLEIQAGILAKERILDTDPKVRQGNMSYIRQCETFSINKLIK